MLRTLVGWLQPRDYRVASRTMAVLTMVAAAVSVTFAAVQPNQSSATLVLTIVIGVLAGLAGWRVYNFHEIHPKWWALAPFLGVAVIVAVDLLTADGSASAQIFFLFPTLYAASQIHQRGAILVTAFSVLGQVVVVLVVLPLREALVNIGYVNAATVTASALLIIAGEHQDELVQQLHKVAAVDSLTGLVTRRVLDQAAQAAMSAAATGGGTALIVIDVDGFKLINDQYGHPAGDQVLVQLAALLVQSCRPTDVASRMGGDELALLLLGCSPAAMASRATHILDQIRAHPFRLDAEHTIRITVSAGLAHTSTQNGSFQAMYRAADEALYRAKRTGRNRFEIAADSQSAQ